MQVNSNLLPPKQTLIDQINNGLSRYYKLCSRDDYFSDDNEQKGKFKYYCAQDGFDEKDVLQQVNQGAAQCIFCDEEHAFDPNFPLIDVQYDDIKRQMIYDILQECATNPDAYKHEAALNKIPPKAKGKAKEVGPEEIKSLEEANDESKQTDQEETNISPSVPEDKNQKAKVNHEYKKQPEDSDSDDHSISSEREDSAPDSVSSQTADEYVESDLDESDHCVDDNFDTDNAKVELQIGDNYAG